MLSNISRREFTKTSLMATLGYMVSCSVKKQFDIIIKNGKILDGTGSQALVNDIGILEDKIVAIGDLSTASAESGRSYPVLCLNLSRQTGHPHEFV